MSPQKLADKLLKTKVSLRRPSAEDSEFIFELFDEDLMTTTDFSRLPSHYDMENWTKDDTDWQFKFVVSYGAEQVGYLSISNPTLPPKRMLSLVVAPEYRGTNIWFYAALLGMLESYRVERTHKFYSLCRADNHRSYRIQNRFFHLDGCYREECHDEAGRLIDVYRFSLLTQKDILPGLGCTFAQFANVFFDKKAALLDATRGKVS